MYTELPVPDAQVDHERQVRDGDRDRGEGEVPCNRGSGTRSQPIDAQGHGEQRGSGRKGVEQQGGKQRQPEDGGAPPSAAESEVCIHHEHAQEGRKGVVATLPRVEEHGHGANHEREREPPGEAIALPAREEPMTGKDEKHEAQREGKARTEGVRAEDPHGCGGEIVGKPGRPDVDTVANIAPIGKDRDGVPTVGGQGKAALQDVLRDRGGVGLVLPESGRAQPREDEQSGSEQEAGEKGVDGGGAHRPAL